MKIDKKKFENPTKFLMQDVNNKVKCKCGKTVEFWSEERKVICTWCNNYVFRTPKDEFNYRVRERLKDEHSRKI